MGLVLGVACWEDHLRSVHSASDVEPGVSAASGGSSAAAASAVDTDMAEGSAGAEPMEASGQPATLEELLLARNLAGPGSQTEPPAAAAAAAAPRAEPEDENYLETVRL